ncbi:MAG TPA: outer membrane lipoprotein carrier protein LolA [Deltaproteobacteria bacterium]|jgi:outer membrane lipoprotein-sorting protein|nr:outer membrane lipoprotein carrier protein LolA [Deltaproteobacteria bacterium]HQI02268.1 outer membrane lipoprotein carrier protein LolA [Deltaproteobacteria bacterium]HQJ09509.1 outer membrane lipoprotein carrier protein LolA [Deltaproteobacteria bacterium]
MQTNWKNRLILTVLILFCSGTLYAESLKNIQNFYKNYKDFTVSFTQDTYQSLVSKTVHFTGKVSYKRNVGVRMDVASPQQQIIILKGKTVLIHLPEEGTTQTQNLPPEMATQNVLGFFSGLDTIGEGYEIKESPEALFLYPKGGSGHITVWTNESHAIRRILLKDATGNQSDIRLSDYKFDVGVPSKVFHLKDADAGSAEKKPKPSVPEMRPEGE